jgi:biopolymer transport protein ExbD
MRRTKKTHISHKYEFELDLAPLLAVMVKLVPVLLISAAFVQMMIIDTDLPQVVQEAIKKQDEQPNKKSISIEVSSADGVKFVVTTNGQAKTELVPVKDGKLDFAAVHSKFVEIKKANPEVFKIELNPSGEIAYKDIVHVMDEARRSRDHIRFPIHDDKNNKDTETEYMFPEIVFGNTLEG